MGQCVSFCLQNLGIHISGVVFIELDVHLFEPQELEEQSQDSER